MFEINTNTEQAEELLVALSRHLPHGFELGRPRIATDGTVLTDDGATPTAFGLDDGGCSAYRVAELGGGWHEVTSFAYGEETARTILVDEPPSDGGDDGGDDGDGGPDPDPVPGADVAAPAVVNAS